MTRSTPIIRNHSAQSNAIGSIDPRTLLTVREIAALDNCSEKTVRRAIRTGQLQAIRVGPGGRLIRITQAAHKAYRQAAFV